MKSLRSWVKTQRSDADRANLGALGRHPPGPRAPPGARTRPAPCTPAGAREGPVLGRGVARRGGSGAPLIGQVSGPPPLRRLPEKTRRGFSQGPSPRTQASPAVVPTPPGAAAEAGAWGGGHGAEEEAAAGAGGAGVRAGAWARGAFPGRLR